MAEGVDRRAVGDFDTGSEHDVGLDRDIAAELVSQLKNTVSGATSVAPSAIACARRACCHAPRPRRARRAS
jgi:hypothetical protein